MGEKSYLKGYVKALDPSIRTKHKSKSWLRGFIDSYYNNGSKGCSIFNGCNGSKSCGNKKHYNDYPMKNMNNNMMMGMFNNIINRLLSILQSFSSQPLNTYNNYNTYNTFSTTNNQNIYNTVYDNDVINNNIFGAGNSIYADA